jgi:hypothetical protein
VPNLDPFSVSGQRLLYPADGSYGASAGNICNCRCCSVGAWPNKPLKPNEDKLPVVKTPGWIEPKYEKAELPTIPMPRRSEPPSTASAEQRLAYQMLRAMDTEQRSQQTVNRINLVRERLTAANDNLESIRQKVIGHAEKLDGLKKALQDAQAKLNATVTEFVKSGKSLTAPELRDLMKVVQAKTKDLSEAKMAVQQTIPSEIGPTSKASVGATFEVNKSFEQMRRRATEAAKWLSRVVSDEHGKTLTFRVAQATEDRACYKVLTKNVYGPAGPNQHLSA